MSCIHTGCRVYLSEYGAVATADAHRIGDTVVFRVNYLDRSTTFDPDTMYEVMKVGPGWFDISELKNGGVSTLVVKFETVRLPNSADTKSRWK